MATSETANFNGNPAEMDKLMQKALKSEHPAELRGGIAGYSSFMGYRYRLNDAKQLVLDFQALWKDGPNSGSYKSTILTLTPDQWEIIGRGKVVLPINADPTEVLVAITEALMNPADQKPADLSGSGLILTIPEDSTGR